MDKWAKYSVILHKWDLNGVRRTKRVLIYPAVSRECAGIYIMAKIMVVFPVAQLAGKDNKSE
jgi:hypothetical protein